MHRDDRRVRFDTRVSASVVMSQLTKVCPDRTMCKDAEEDRVGYNCEDMAVTAETLRLAATCVA